MYCLSEDNQVSTESAVIELVKDEMEIHISLTLFQYAIIYKLD